MQIRKLSAAIALGLTTTSTLSVAAPVAQQEIEKITVSSRVMTPLREIATSVSVFDEQELALRGMSNLSEVLRTAPAVSVSNSGGVGSVTSLRIRGEEGYRTLVRVDGVDISDPTGTQVNANIGQLQTANVSRVEILRGPQGLVYGADAGGVVNIQTGRLEQGMYGSISGEAGRFDTHNVSGEIGGGNDTVSAYLSASDFSTNGFNARLDDTELQDDDGYDNTTFHGRVAVKATDRLTLGLVGRSNQGENQFDGCFDNTTFASINTCSDEFEQNNLRVSADYALDSGHHQLAYTKTLIERENFSAGESSYLTKGTTERVEYVGNTRINSAYQLIYGIDWEEESITSAGQSRTQTGYYAELQSEPVNNLFTTAGLRYDDNEDFGEHVSYRLSSAYLWQTQAGEVKLRGAYGTGFRAPSLYEVEYNRGEFAYSPASDTTLSEEKSEGYEVGVRLTPQSGSFIEVVYFDQQIEDNIYFDLTTFSGYLQDIGTSYSDGVELIGQWLINDSWQLNANYTYNETEDTSGDQRSRRPRQLGTVAVTYTRDALSAAASLRMVADSVDNGMKLKDYALLDISARYALSPAFSVFARLENALDEDYQDISAYHTSGAALYAGAKYQF